VEGNGLEFYEVVGDVGRDFVFSEGDVVSDKGDESSAGFVLTVSSDGGVAGEVGCFIGFGEFGFL